MKKRKKPYTTRVYLAKLSVEEGLKLISNVKKDSPPLYIQGERVRAKSEFRRFEVLVQGPLKCFDCGCEATHFMIERHKNENAYHINAYAGSRMLTWDHIIPRSLGGSDHVHNARVACEICNVRRGNEMNIIELLWVTHQDPNEVFKQVHFKPNSFKQFKTSLNILARTPISEL